MQERPARFYVPGTVLTLLTTSLTAVCLGGCALLPPGIYPSFTYEERKQFSDISSSTQRKVLDPVWHGEIFWVDDDHIITSSPNAFGSKDGWNRPKIIIEDVRTGEIKDTGLIGKLECYSNGFMRVYTPPQPGEKHSTPYKGTLLSGLTESNAKNYSHITCTDMGDRQTGDPYYIPLNDHLTLKLEGGPSLLNPGGRIQGDLIDLSDGSVKHITGMTADSSGLGSGPESYGSFNEKYFFPGLVEPDINNMFAGHQVWRHAGGLLSASGQFEPLEADPFLREMATKHRGAGTVYITRMGILTHFYALSPYNYMNGLYLRGSSGLSRLDAADIPVKQVSVSPNGCLVYYTRRNIGGRGFANIGISNYQNVLIDVCNAKK